MEPRIETRRGKRLLVEKKKTPPTATPSTLTPATVQASTQAGAPIRNFTGSLTVGEGGPIVLQDIYFLERMQHALRERIPERFVHAKGAGAHGYFEVTNDITSHCKASLFSEVGKKTKCMVRLSTVDGERGSSDNERDARGFAVKFYTDEGIWDLLSLSTAVFFIRDPILFPHLAHCQKRNPSSNLKDPNAFWDFMTIREESVHMLMMIFADRGIPDGYQHMNGYSGNTFTMVNTKQEAVYVRFKWKTNQGVQNITNPKDPRLNDLDYSTQLLYDGIKRGEYPSWTLQYQYMTPAQAQSPKYKSIAFDVTKVWPHTDFPLNDIGKLTLNANPNNYFAEVEQAAFSPSRLVPGIEGSPDQLLQGRIFAYNDTQVYRLGVNYNQLPVNRTQHRPHNYQRDGAQAIIDPSANEVNYYPNSFNGPQPDNHTLHSITVTGDVKRYDTDHMDNFTQATVFYNKILNADMRGRLGFNIAENLKGANTKLQMKAVAMFNKVNAELAKTITKYLSTPQVLY
ncbi:catalase [Paramuricea clavata]|uniref:Catalase n=1 Tax=Paramuricea clavata TaxID=317549 RepID=A0A7D9ELT4_PARCT|nr:catalase [Paramuricea clavata]